MIAVTDLLTPVTAAQMRTTLVSLMVTLGVRADLWRAGGVASTILTVCANTAATFSSLMVAALSGNYLDYASGSWLVLLAYYVYGVTALPATFASGEYTLTNTGGGVYTASWTATPTGRSRSSRAGTSSTITCWRALKTTFALSSQC